MIRQGLLRRGRARGGGPGLPSTQEQLPGFRGFLVWKMRARQSVAWASPSRGTRRGASHLESA